MIGVEIATINDGPNIPYRPTGLGILDFDSTINNPKKKPLITKPPKASTAATACKTGSAVCIAIGIPGGRGRSPTGIGI